MKLCLLIATAVVIATSYALPVPKEEVFTVYPVNSAYGRELENKQSEQPNTPLEAVKAKDLSSEGKVEATEKLAEKPVEVKIVLVEKLSEQSAVQEEPATTQSNSSPVPETKSAPLKESSDVKVEESPATVSRTVETPTTVALNDELRIVITETVVATEPKRIVPETVVEERKPVEELKDEKVADQAAVKTEEKEAVGKSVESEKVEEKKEENVEVNQSEPKAAADAVVKPVTEEKSEKLTTEPKAEAVTEQSQARSASSDLPAEQSESDVKSEENGTTDQVEVKSVEVTTSAAVEKAEESSTAEPKVQVPTLAGNDPEPQTEGKGEVKPTKVRAAPIIEDLKVLQPVEAEPASVAKIHVTVIQEEVLLDKPKNAPQQEVVKDAAVPVTEAEEESTNVPVTTTVATEQEVKSDAVATEKAPEAKDEVSNDEAGEVKSVEVVVAPKPEAPKTVEINKEENSKATPEAVAIVVPSLKLEDVTTVAAVSTDKPTESVEDKSVPEVRSAAGSDELPEPATTAKAVEQQAKAVEGSSQPGASESAAAAQEVSQDQSDSVSTTVSSVTEQDTTTVVTTTAEPETVPTPAKQKAKKQAPPNFKGYSKRLKLQEAQRKQTPDSQ